MIYLLWPTARPNIFKETHKFWLKKADDPKNIKTMVAVDTKGEKKQLSDYNVIVTEKKEPGVAVATYALSKIVQAELSDIIILASDDFYPPDSWDTWVIGQFTKFKGALMIRDGYQEGGCITLPIMTYDCLLKLNRVIYHPSYRHQFSDAELWVNLRDLKLLKNLRDKRNPLFEHKHWANGKRNHDHVDALCNSNGGKDSNNYDKRLKMSVEERLKV